MLFKRRVEDRKDLKQLLILKEISIFNQKGFGLEAKNTLYVFILNQVA